MWTGTYIHESKNNPLVWPPLEACVIGVVYIRRCDTHINHSLHFKGTMALLSSSASSAHFANLVEKDSHAEFDVEGIDLCIVNSVRRVIMSDVQTAAFNYDPTHPAAAGSGIAILRNTSSLNNEFVGQRVSLVPLGFDPNQLRMFEPSRFKCVLKVKNAGNTVRDVTTGDFEVFDQGGALHPKAVRDAIFPANPLTGDHILLLRLKPSTQCDGNGEEIHVECHASVGTGRMHARWSPVSSCFFRFKKDPGLVKAALDARISALDEKRLADGKPPLDVVERERERVQHDALDAHRCFLRSDATGEPVAFEFIIDCETRHRPSILVFEALRVLHDKVMAFREALVGSMDEGVGGEDGAQYDDTHRKVVIKPFANTDDFYHVLVRKEDHSLGNLVQGMLYGKWVRDGGSKEVSYIGYYMPHPLETNIVIKIKCAIPGDDVVARLSEGATWLAGELNALMVEWVMFAGLDKAGIVTIDEMMMRMGKRAVKK